MHAPRGQSGNAATPAAVEPEQSGPEPATDAREPIASTGRRRLLLAAHPRRWQLWTLQRRVVAFLASWEALAAGVVTWAVLTTVPATLADWIRLATLAACATAHIQITRQQDERRRSRMTSVYVDLTGMWIFPAALLLPVPLTLLLVVLVGGQRWVNWRRPPHRYLYSMATSALAVVATNQLYTAFDSSGLQTSDSWGAVEFGILALAGVVYTAIQVVAVAVVIALSSVERPRLRTLLGTPLDNMLDAATVGVGALAAIVLVTVPPAVIVLVLVSVLGNRLAEIGQLQEEAQTDAKTGLLNMRGWSESAQRAFARAQRGNTPVALLMIDLDHFKWINDTYGHPAGDDVIVGVGRILEKAIRPSDIIGRFGGEEFVVLLVDADPDAAGRAAERIRQAIAFAEITTTGRRGAPVTITDRTTSVGIAVHPTHGTTVSQLLHAADAAVYVAKEWGRDQAQYAPTPYQSPPTSADPQS